MNNSCCAASEACSKDSVCDACLQDPNGAGCANNTNFNALTQCQSDKCYQACTFNACNPVSNNECKGTSGSACDLASDGGFLCFEGPFNTGKCGEACGTDNFCEGGYTCIEKKCARYCCADSDCGPSGTCSKTAGHPDVGVCLQKGNQQPVCQGLAANPTSSCSPVDDLTPGGSCGAIFPDSDACGTCMEKNCCAELDVCLLHEACTACLSGDNSACFDAIPLNNLDSCQTAKCAKECSP